MVAQVHRHHHFVHVANALVVRDADAAQLARAGPALHTRVLKAFALLAQLRDEVAVHEQHLGLVELRVREPLRVAILHAQHT